MCIGRDELEQLEKRHMDIEDIDKNKTQKIECLVDQAIVFLHRLVETDEKQEMLENNIKGIRA